VIGQCAWQLTAIVFLSGERGGFSSLSRRPTALGNKAEGLEGQRIKLSKHDVANARGTDQAE